MSKIDVKAALGAAALVSKTITALTDKKQELLADRQLAQKAQQKLYSAALPREECLALVLKTIDDAGREFPALAGWDGIMKSFAQPKGRRPRVDAPVDFSPAGAGTHSGPINLADLVQLSGRGNGAIHQLIGLDGASFFGGAGDRPPHFENARACFLFGDVIKAAVSHNFDRLFPAIDGNVSGDIKAMSIAERQSQIEVLQAEIDALDAQIAEIDEQLATLPAPKR